MLLLNISPRDDRCLPLHG